MIERRLLAASALLLLLAGCNAVLGLDDFEVGQACSRSGQMSPCACDGGGTGVAMCRADYTLGECSCSGSSSLGGAGGTSGQGAGGTGASSGQGGSGGSPVCGLEANTPSCTSCFQAHCCLQGKACASSQSCLLVLDCYQKCSTTSCYDQCDKSNPLGAAVFQKVNDCLTTSCKADCGG